MEVLVLPGAGTALEVDGIATAPGLVLYLILL